MKNTYTKGITLRLNEEELKLLSEAKQRALSVGKGNLSNRQIFMEGIENIIKINSIDTMPK